MAIIYATLDGEPIIVTRKRARKLLERTLPDGRFMFQADSKKAPPYQKGAVKCFLHKYSEERDLMDSLGLQGKFCPAGQLANAYAKHIHETGKHVKSYQILERHRDDAKEKATIERQDRQFNATMEQNAAILELARANQGGAVAVGEPVRVEVEDSEMPGGPLTMCDVEDCDYTGTIPQVRGHKLGAHK
jgi:hypothetical protein